MAIPLADGAPQRIRAPYCLTRWSTDGKFLFVSVEYSSRTGPGHPSGSQNSPTKLACRRASSTSCKGAQEVGEAITNHPDIKAVTFIGSTAVAKSVYARGAGNGKRVQCMGGAKNHGVILPDADLDQAVADILAGAFGSAGERCMSMPVIVPVGRETAEAVRKRLLQEIPKLRIGCNSPNRCAPH